MTTDERAAKRAGAQKFWAAHRATWEASGGTEMTEVLGMDVVQLNTVGRSSGELRWVLLTTLPAETGWLVVASNLGADTDPNWWANLQAAGGKGKRHREGHDHRGHGDGAHRGPSARRPTSGSSTPTPATWRTARRRHARSPSSTCSRSAAVRRWARGHVVRGT